MIALGNLFFIVEILLGELIFLFSAPKRPHFWARIILSITGVIILSELLPMPDSLLGNTGYQLFRFLLLLALSITAMGISFKIGLSSLISGCAAGYAVQHISYQITSMISHSVVFSTFGTDYLSRQYLLELLVFIPSYALYLFTIGLYAEKTQWYKKSDPRFNLISLIIIFICVGLSRFTRIFGGAGTISVSLYAIICCALALIIQFGLYRMLDLKLENTTINLLWQDDRKQYEISKKTIDTINIKYHDLKHKLSDLKGRLPDEDIASIKDAVRIFSGKVQTGNDALDVLLTENNLRCSEEGITMTFSGNGADLSFVQIMDVYSLFGNAIDNAVEAVRELKDPEKKIIDITTSRIGDMVSINVSNFFEGEIIYDNELPVTSKTYEEGYHGFGMKSMKLIAEKYGGRLTVDTQKDLFNLGIYLMAK